MVQVLLRNCLDLLNNDPRPDDHLEIITSSHYLLAEVYSMPNTAERRENATHPCDEEEFPWPKTLAIGDLSKSNSFEESYEEVALHLPVDVHEKLQLSLSNVVKALKSLHRAMDDRKFSVSENESKRQTVLPSRPYILALPDATFSARSGDEFVSQVTGSNDDMTPVNFNFRQWQGTFESVLIRKAAGLYSDLASLAQTEGTHGLALRYLQLSLQLLSSYRNLEWVNTNQELDLLPTVLCRCGDVYMSMAKSRDLQECMEASAKDYGTECEYDLYFDTHYRIADEAVYQLDIDFAADVEKLYKKSESLYERALDVSSDSRQVEQLVVVTRRLGNIRNELGMFYMNTAVSTSAGADVVILETFWKKSLESFSSGIRAFEAVDDRPNIALLHSNSGRLMRICAQTLFSDPDKRGTFSSQEKTYYTSAVEHYQKSLGALGERKSCAEVWDRVTWELSGTHYTMGTLIQDYFSVQESEAEKCEREVSDLMFKSLKLCESLQFSDENVNRDVRQRIGTIHYRLASLYHNSYRMLPPSDPNARKKRHLAELHYVKATEHIDVTLHPTEWLRTNLERVALLEHQLGSARTKGSGASKVFDSILVLLLNSKQAFEAYNAERTGLGASRNNSENIDKKHKPDEASNSELSFDNIRENETGKNINDKRNFSDDSANCGTNSSAEDDGETLADEEFSNLLNIFEARLKNCLKEQVKLRASGKTGAGTMPKEREDVLKRMYELTLRASLARKSEEMSSVRHCEQMLETVVALERLQYGTGLNS